MGRDTFGFEFLLIFSLSAQVILPSSSGISDKLVLSVGGGAIISTEEDYEDELLVTPHDLNCLW